MHKLSHLQTISLSSYDLTVKSYRTPVLRGLTVNRSDLVHESLIMKQHLTLYYLCLLQCFVGTWNDSKALCCVNTTAVLD